MQCGSDRDSGEIIVALVDDFDFGPGGAEAGDRLDHPLHDGPHRHHERAVRKGQRVAGFLDERFRADHRAIIALIMAASAGFAAPIGYQTDLMAYGAGGCRFSVYLRIGIPLDILVAAVMVVVATMFWPL